MAPLSRDFDETAQAQRDSILRLLRKQGIVWTQIFFLILLSVFPFKFLHFAEVRPAFLPMAVYFWAVYTPHRVSPLTAFFAGLVLDLLSAAPAGLNALTMVAIQKLTGSQRKFLASQPFLVLWLGFFLLVCGAFTFQWAAMSLFHWTLVPPRSMLFSAALTGLFYPVVAGVLGLLSRASGPGRSGG